MLDPLTSLGLVSNVVQLVDFGMKVVQTGREIATTGTKAEHTHLKAIASNTAALCAELHKHAGVFTMADLEDNANEESGERKQGEHKGPRDEKSVLSLAMRTRGVAEDLSLMLQGLKMDDCAPEESIDQHGQQAKHRKRKRDVANCIVKSIWKDGDLQKLKKQLVELQQEMILSLSVMESQKSSSILRSLGKMSQSLEDQRQAQLAQFERRVPQVLEEVSHNRNARSGAEYEELLANSLERISQQARTINVCQRIQKSLAFEEIHRREESIAEAHANTFEWIFKQPELRFTEWASQKNGLFWITGKAGSGKSTLMKYIVNHPRTLKLLNTWAGDDELVVAHHYFWNSGTILQKSQVGLLRTLLFHIVGQCPETAVRLVPQRFHERSGYETMPWTLKELCTTLESFGTQRKLENRLCFFIDGLDEYPDEHQVDLVEFLSKLTACPSIKLCVASRPWNVFHSAYDQRADGQLEVQELTRNDIHTYVSDQMNKSRWFGKLRDIQPKGCSDLVAEITDRAQGVFLWVYLVVRSLLRGLNNDDGLKELRQRLRGYPQTLNGYFQRMSDRIEELYRGQSARIMLVALKAKEPLPLCAPHCLEHEMVDIDYALKVRIKKPREKWLSKKVRQGVLGDSLAEEPCGELNDNPWSSRGSEHLYKKEEEVDAAESPMFNEVFTTVTSKVAVSKRYLDARCADLLEIDGDRISFIHRTARDFLELPHVLQVLNNQAGVDFDPSLSLARLALWRIKSLTDNGTTIETLLHDMLKEKDFVASRNLAAFGELLYDFDACGDEILEAHENVFGGSDNNIQGMLFFDEGQGSYHDSMLSFAVSAALNVLRERIRPKEATLPSAEDEGNEEEDFSILFGWNSSRGEGDGIRGRTYMVEYDATLKQWLRRPPQPP